MSRVLDRVQQVIEYLLALAFIVSAISLMGADDLTGNGALAIIFGSHIALYVYMVWFFFLGFGLIYAKVRKKKRTHKNMLMAMYLTTVYTSILSVFILGFAWTQIIDDLVICALAAWFWLRWKFKTEYIDPGHFYSSVSTLKEDPPPLS